MKASELRPETWIAGGIRVRAVMMLNGRCHCHVRMYGTEKDLSPAELRNRLGARSAEVADGYSTYPALKNKPTRLATVVFDPDDTVLGGY
jgi:hypothetical protein